MGIGNRHAIEEPPRGAATTICDTIRPAMTITRGDLSVRTESRGAHWISWVTRGATATPLDAVILVGQTQDEAEMQANAWADKLAADPVLIRS